MPQKFGSVRHRGRPPTLRTPFRDDTGLVALRYEQTKQAEPPIPLPPPRNPRRVSRPASTTAPSTRTAPAPAPIIVSPPPVPPPQEEHPLFRDQPRTPQSPQSPRSLGEEAKRDSGLAPTTSSAATLREECADDPVYQKLLDDIADAASVYSNDDQPSIDERLRPAPLQLSPAPRRAEDARDEDGAPTQPAQTAQHRASPTRRVSLTRRLSRNLGIGAGRGGSRRLRKRMAVVSGSDRAPPPPPPSPPPAAETERGSATDSGRPAPQPAKPPSSPAAKSPKRAPLAAGLLQAARAGPSPADRGEHTLISAGAAGAAAAAAAATATAIAAPARDGRARRFAPINTHIPEDNLWDDLATVSFSKRGSIMFGGKRSLSRLHRTTPSSSAAEALVAPPEDHAQPPSQQSPSIEPHHPAKPAEPAAAAAAAAATSAAATHADSPSVPSIRVSSIDIERESQKVRSLYESGDDLQWEDGGRASFAERLEPTAEVPSEEEENVVYGFPICLSALRCTAWPDADSSCFLLVLFLGLPVPPIRPLPTRQRATTPSLRLRTRGLQLPRDRPIPHRRNEIAWSGEEGTSAPAASRTGRTLTASRSTAMASSPRSARRPAPGRPRRGRRAFCRGGGTS